MRLGLALSVLLGLLLLPGVTRAGTPVTVSLDAVTDAGPVNPLAWGVGAPGRELPWVGNAAVSQRLSEAGIKIVRVGAIQQALYDGQDPDPVHGGPLNFSRLDQMLNTIFDGGAQPLFLACGFPAGVGASLNNHLIVAADWNEYARVMSNVVYRYNVQKALGPARTVTYWELWNEPTVEPDGTFASHSAYLAFALPVANAMKAADPTIRILAPADAWADLGSSGYSSYVAKNLEAQVDVLDWHNYAPGPDQGKTDADRMAWTVPSYQNDPRTVAGGGSGNIFVGPTGKHYGTAITEYNFSGSDFGAAFDLEYHNQYNSTFVGSAILNALKGNLSLFCFFTLSQAGTEPGANLLSLLHNTDFSVYDKPY